MGLVCENAVGAEDCRVSVPTRQTSSLSSSDERNDAVRTSLTRQFSSESRSTRPSDVAHVTKNTCFPKHLQYGKAIWD